MHGLLVDGRLWRKVVPRLEGDFRCIVPDWPLGSHVRALRPDADLSPPGLARIVADLMEALDLDGVTLVGNDTGGAISQLVATRHRERLARLVLTPCDAFEVFPPALFKPLVWAAHPRIKASSWTPDIFRNEDFYLSDSWLGGAWKAMRLAAIAPHSSPISR